MTETKELYLKQLRIGPMDNFIYLVGDPASGECVMIDPAWDAEAVLQQASKDHMKVTAGLLTHTHFDHSNAAEALAEKIGGKIFAHEEEAGYVKGLGRRLEKTRDGSRIRIGVFEIQCLHTPGHTPGGQCFLVEGHLFTGDTLFVGACGRCDLEKSDPQAMYQSLQKIAALGDDIRVYPGHDYGEVPVSTVGREKKNNPYYQRSSLEAFLAFRSR